jgi:hypothetical protein
MIETALLTLTTLVSLSNRLLRMALHLNLLTFDWRTCTARSETADEVTNQRSSTWSLAYQLLPYNYSMRFTTLYTAKSLTMLPASVTVLECTSGRITE